MVETVLRLWLRPAVTSLVNVSGLTTSTSLAGPSLGWRSGRLNQRSSWGGWMEVRGRWRLPERMVRLVGWLS